MEVFAFIPMKFVLTVEPPAVAANVGGLMGLLLLIELRKALSTVPSSLIGCMFLTLLLLLPPPPPDIIWSVISVSRPSKEGGVALLLLSLLVCIMMRCTPVVVVSNLSCYVLSSSPTYLS